MLLSNTMVWLYLEVIGGSTQHLKHWYWYQSTQALFLYLEYWYQSTQSTLVLYFKYWYRSTQALLVAIIRCKNWLIAGQNYRRWELPELQSFVLILLSSHLFMNFTSYPIRPYCTPLKTNSFDSWVSNEKLKSFKHTEGDPGFISSGGPFENMLEFIFFVKTNIYWSFSGPKIFISNFPIIFFQWYFSCDIFPNDIR